MINDKQKKQRWCSKGIVILAVTVGLSACAPPPTKILTSFVMPPTGISAEQASSLQNIQVGNIKVRLTETKKTMLSKAAIADVVRGLIKRQIAASVVERIPSYTLLTRGVSGKRNTQYTQLKRGVEKSKYGFVKYDPAGTNTKADAYVDASITVSAKRTTKTEKRQFKLKSVSYDIDYSKERPTSKPNYKQATTRTVTSKVTVHKIKVTVDGRYLLRDGKSGKIIYTLDPKPITETVVAGIDSRQPLPNAIRLVHKVVHKDTLNFARAIAKRSEKREMNVALDGEVLSVKLLLGNALTEAEVHLDRVLEQHNRTIKKLEKERDETIKAGEEQVVKEKDAAKKEKVIAKVRKEAKEDFLEAIAPMAGDFFNRGLIDEAKGIYLEAEKHYQTALKFRPSDPLIQAGRQRIKQMIRAKKRSQAI